MAIPAAHTGPITVPADGISAVPLSIPRPSQLHSVQPSRLTHTATHAIRGAKGTTRHPRVPGPFLRLSNIRVGYRSGTRPQAVDRDALRIYPKRGDGRRRLTQTASLIRHVARRSLKGTLSSPVRSPQPSRFRRFRFAFRGLRAPVEPGACSEGDPGRVGKHTSGYRGANDACESKSPKSPRKHDRLVVHHWLFRRVIL
jgi:hypothetical protein